MAEMEPLADVVTGGVAARAVEPEAGAVGTDGHTHESDCLNCGTALKGDYCHSCGQRAHVHRSLHAFAHDLLHGVFHFEGKIWQTLPMLAWRPGELTRRYIHGERARFVSPIALFLFAMFLMFATLGSVAHVRAIPPTRQAIEEEIGTLGLRIEQLESLRSKARAAGQRTSGLDRQIAAAREEQSALRSVRDRGITGAAVDDVAGEMPDWARGAVRKAGTNPDLLLYKIKTNAYKYSWMLIPLSLPFMWLLFARSRRFRMYDHTVFVTYSLCFMALLAVFAALLGKAGLGALAAVLWLVPPIHMYRQLKGAYGLTPARAALKTLALIGIAGIASLLFLAILLAVGVF